MATFRKLPSGKWQALVSKEGNEFSVGKKADVEYTCTHIYRHTHAALKHELGTSLKYVLNRLEHKLRLS